MSLPVEISNPDILPNPLGLYSHVAVATGSKIVFVAGQLPVAKDGSSVGEGDLRAQMLQILSNLRDALGSQGLSFENIVKFTTYLTDEGDIDTFMKARRELFPKFFATTSYPPNTLLVIKRLVHKEFQLEIEAIAVSD